MKKDKVPVILEFEVIAPTTEREVIGDKYELSSLGYYSCDQSGRHLALLYLLDHTLHYRVTKIRMNGITYEIPADREKNLEPSFRMETKKLDRRPPRIEMVRGSLGWIMEPDPHGRYVEYEKVKHLF